MRRDPPSSAGFRTSFVQKVLQAQAAGAVMVIVANYDDEVLRPSVGNTVKTKLTDGQNVTVPVL